METDKIKVLLIEDNPGDARLIQLMLEEESNITFSVEVAETLSNALERLNSASFNVIMSDLGLPDSKGIDTFFKLYSAESIYPLPISVFTCKSGLKVSISHH